MVLTSLQRQVMQVIAVNRSATSYMAGGAVLNKDWLRLSDDLDIFHDTDEEIVASAKADMSALEAAGFKVVTDVMIYGVVESTVSKGGQSTVLQWMSETKIRFFPLVRDTEWGARLHTADLAVNKVLAASSRTKARDYVDLVTIAKNYSGLGPLILAAAGKPPNYSPQKIVDEIRRRSQSVPAEDIRSVRGLPQDESVEGLRSALMTSLDDAETYLQQIDPELVGLLAVDSNALPVTVSNCNKDSLTLRRATAEPETIPQVPGEHPPFTR